MVVSDGSMTIGDASVARVLEWVGRVVSADFLLPETPPEAWNAAPPEALSFRDPLTREWRAAMQTWVVRISDLVILVDTGVGNARDRPQAPRLSQLNSAFFTNLAAVGVERNDVDVVVNTHIHYDHVGWNTQSVDGEWSPTFPNARYLTPRDDYALFDPANGTGPRAPRTEDERRRFEGSRRVFEDSIAPVRAAGLMDLWNGYYAIAPGFYLEQVGGHTPGSSVAWLDHGEGAVFVGDLLHAPVQVARPDDRMVFDLDDALAKSTRRRILDRAADERRWVFPAHVAGHGAFRVHRAGKSFGIDEWAPFPEV